MNKKLLLALLCLCALLIQGCALVYVEDRETNDGAMKREYGLLGGLLPLYRYTGQRPNEDCDHGEPDSHDQDQSQSRIGE
ncbi:MAG TPA: hypothetical protein VM186_13390 [Planctomycetota bacterium]|nr:hypothetical protein [Planctomycetota bacterium]